MIACRRRRRPPGVAAIRPARVIPRATAAPQVLAGPSLGAEDALVPAPAATAPVRVRVPHRDARLRRRARLLVARRGAAGGGGARAGGPVGVGLERGLGRPRRHRRCHRRGGRARPRREAAAGPAARADGTLPLRGGLRLAPGAPGPLAGLHPRRGPGRRRNRRGRARDPPRRAGAPFGTGPRDVRPRAGWPAPRRLERGDRVGVGGGRRVGAARRDTSRSAPSPRASRRRRTGGSSR